MIEDCFFKHIFTSRKRLILQYISKRLQVYVILVNRGEKSNSLFINIVHSIDCKVLHEKDFRCLLSDFHNVLQFGTLDTFCLIVRSMKHFQSC